MTILESRRDNLLQPYVDLCLSKGIKTNVSEMKQYLLRKFVNEALIRNLSLSSNFYLAGVARYYFNGDLTTNKELNVFNENVKDQFIEEVCTRLNAVIVVLRNAYIDSVGEKFEQPEDFGTLSLKQLFRKYGAAINKELGIEGTKRPKKEEEEINYNVGSDYTFDILYSYEDATKYNRFTEPGAWCITYGQHHYNAYIRRLNIHYVIFLKNGYENVPREKGPNWTPQKPQDEYGNSMIALLQSNVDGSPVYITSRWNHGSYADDSHCEADHAYTPEEFYRVTGTSPEDLQRIFKLWKAEAGKKKSSSSNPERKAINAERTRVLRGLKYIQMKINGGEQDPFEGCEYNAKIMSKSERFNALNAELTKKLNEIPFENEDEKVRFRAESKKILQKALFNEVAAYWIKLDGEEKYYFLMDKKKILFETMVRADTDWDSFTSYFQSSEDKDNDRDAANYNNVVICHVINGTMIYNMRYHEFVNIGGVRKFKYMPRLYGREVEHGGFYEVYLSGNQMALVNWKTNRPLRLPNGEFWFEYLLSPSETWRRYGRDIRPRFKSNTEGSLMLCYDSSADIKFWLDMSSMQFFTPPTVDNTTGQEIKPQGFYQIGSNRDGVYALNYRVGGDNVLKIFKGTEEIGQLRDLKIRGAKYVGGDDIFIDTESEKFIYCATNGEIYKTPLPAESHYYQIYGYDDDRVAIILAHGGTRHDSGMLFDNKYKQFIKNPLNNSYYFEFTNRYFDKDGERIPINLENRDTRNFKISADDPVLEPMAEPARAIRENNTSKKTNNMNKVVKINENTIRKIVATALLESMADGLKKNADGNWINRFDDEGNETDEYLQARYEDPDFDRFEKEDEIDDMENWYSNNNIYDSHGALGMMAQGDEEDPETHWARAARSSDDETAMNMGTWALDNHYLDESKIRKIVAENIRKFIKNRK